MLSAPSAVRSCARRTASRALVARRNGSTSSHHHDEHHHDADHHSYEGFATPFWRNVVLAGFGVAAFYKWAPAPGDDVYLTRWIAMYTKPEEHWLDINAKHTALSQEVSDQSLLFRDAKQPAVHRLRYPQRFEQHSPFLAPVGLTVSTRDLEVKREQDV